MDEHKDNPQQPNQPEQPAKQQLLGQEDWDTHNKKAERAAKAYQDFMSTDAAAAGAKNPKKSGGKGKRWLAVVGVVVLLAAAGGAVYAFVLKDKGGSKAQDTSQTDATTPTETASSLGSSNMEEYTATGLGLSFSYPDDWEVDDSDMAKLTVTSPKVKLQTAGGVETSGKVVLTIRAKGQPLPEFEKGDGLAVRASELLTYKKPSPTQRANTHLSFVAYAGNTNGLDGMYITGDYGYQKDQGVLQTEVAAIDPIISVTFFQCSDDACGTSTPLSISTASWDDMSFANPLRTMLQSITVQ